MSGRVRMAITASSREVLPARSPRPLMVHSICCAPPMTPARELATAMPRSLWQWTENSTRSEPGTRAMTVEIRERISSGVV